MPRVVSFIVLLAVILLIGSMFFQVMVQFIVPLFLAAVFVVIFKPLHQWMLEKCGHRKKITAALTTLTIVLIVLLPLTGLLMKSVSEGVALVRQNIDSDEMPLVEEDNAQNAKEAKAKENALKLFVDNMVDAMNSGLEKLRLPTYSSDKVYVFLKQKVADFAAPLVFGGFEILASTLIGLAIMVLTMYYFFSDGANMAEALMKLSPMDDAYEQELLEKFSDISRAVVLASLLSAAVQGILAGIGYYFAGVESIFFLTMLTAVLSMVPFIGGAAVWVPVCAWLYFGNGEATAAIALAIYCGTVVSMSDNLIKPMVLHGQSNLHPLLALLSVIGGVQALGPIGILVGPMLVAFLQALLNMLNKELKLLGKESDETGTPVVFATGKAEADKHSTPRKKHKKKK